MLSLCRRSIVTSTITSTSISTKASLCSQLGTKASFEETHCTSKQDGDRCEVTSQVDVYRHFGVGWRLRIGVQSGADRRGFSEAPNGDGGSSIIE